MEIGGEGRGGEGRGGNTRGERSLKYICFRQDF